MARSPTTTTQFADGAEAAFALPTPTPTNASAVADNKAATPNGISPDLYHYCTSGSMADAERQLMSPQVRAQLGVNAVNSSDLLMTWFQDADFKGQHTNIFGGSGPCDSAGYRVQPDGFWMNNMSSVAGTDQCNEVDLTTQSLTFADDFSLPVSYIGNTLNDNVGLTHIYNL